MQAQDLADAVMQPLVVAVEPGEAPDVHRGQVEGRLTRDDPLRQRPPGSARGRDADGVEACPHEEVPQLWCLTEDELVVGGKALRAVVELLYAGFGEDRYPRYRAVHEDREVVPVLVEKLELERVGQLVRRDPWLGLRLESADDQPADFFLEVGVAVRVTQYRQVPVRPVDPLGHHVEVLGGVQRHRYPAHRADLLGPLAGAVDDYLSLDVAPVGTDPGHGAGSRADAGHPDPLADQHAPLAGAPGQRRGQVRGIRPAVAWQPDRPDDVVDRHDRVSVAGLRGRDQLAVQLIGLGGRGGPAQLHHAIVSSGDGHATTAAEAGTQASLLLQPPVQLGGVLHQPRAVFRGAQLADQAGRVPGSAA